MKTLTCSACGDLVARLDDARFPLVPAGLCCPLCAHPAYARLLRGVAAC